MKLGEAIKSGIGGGVMSVLGCSLVTYALVPFPGDVTANVVNNALSGGVSGFMSGFVGVILYMKQQKKNKPS